MRFFYDCTIQVLVLAIRVAALFNAKARLWVNGRRNWRTHLSSTFHRPSSTVHRPSSTLWIHAASLGEFEQGRPIIEAFRARFPDWKIVLTFFSPSGYEVRKDYPQADLVCYLPADTRQNAQDFLEIIQPDVAIFVKYEFWANYLFELKKRGVTTILVSAFFRPSQPFFKWYGRFWQKILSCFTHIFVQNESSTDLLKSIGFGQNSRLTVAGDTRVDRVLKIAAETKDNAVVQAFTSAAKGPILVVGSSWEPDETVIFEAIKRPELQAWTLILAPHEPSEANVTRIAKQLSGTIRYTQATNTTTGTHLIIDNIGLLNTLYRYGRVAYIGGGLSKGIHNTLEPAAFGLPILFGPKYEKFEEARQFVTRGGAFSIATAEELTAILTKLQDPVFYQKASDAVRAYLEESRGATEKVMEFLEEKIGAL